MADPKGGILVNDDTGMITNTVKDLMKGALKSIMTGKLGDLMKMRTPAYVHCGRTYLNMLVFEVSFLEKMLLKCQTDGFLENPVERMKYISTAMLASLHSGIEVNGLLTPLNPILGETACVKTENGGTIYCEQTSHHPPISHILYEGPASCPFVLSGYYQFKLGVSKSFTCAYFSAPGKVKLTLPNKDIVHLSSKTIEISGLMSTSKLLNVTGSMVFNDAFHGLTSTCSFDAQQKQRTGYWTSWVKGADKVNKDSGVLDNRRDLVNIQIT